MGAPAEVRTKIKNHLTDISSSLAGDVSSHDLDEWLCTVKHTGGAEDLGSENDPMYRRYLHQHREDAIGNIWDHNTHKVGESSDNTKATNAEAGHYEIKLHLKGKLVHTGAGGNLVGISNNRIGGLTANNPQPNTNGIPPVTNSNPNGGWPTDNQTPAIQLPYAQSKD